jgi:hypothetical protein
VVCARPQLSRDPLGGTVGVMPEAGISRKEIFRLVNGYIGVSGGYLGDFSYRTHEEFYPEFCDLDINPSEIEGTTRQRFVAILERSSPDIQARIVRGILRKYPAGSAENRTGELHDELQRIAQRLEGAPVAAAAPAITSETVARAIRDAEALIRESGATSGVDRIHTVLHGYLIAVCDSAGIEHPEDASLPRLLFLITKGHPKLQDRGPRADDVLKILRSFAAVVDALHPVRNKASLAHPNKLLLPEPEAMLVINAARTILNYLDAKLSS